MAIKDDKERISVYLDKDLKNWLVSVAKQHNRSMSNYIGTTLEQIRKGEVKLDSEWP